MDNTYGVLLGKHERERGHADREIRCIKSETWYAVIRERERARERVASK